LGKTRKRFHFGRPLASSALSCAALAAAVFFWAAIFFLRDVGVGGWGRGGVGVGGCSRRVGVRSHASRDGGGGGGWEVSGGMQACARVRSRVSDQGHCKVRLEEGQRLGCRARVEAVCQVRSAELTGQCRSRTAPGSPCPAMEGGRSEATSTSMLLRCAVCCSRHGHGERYHERAFLAAIITSEPRVDTLDCTPGATKALADAAARTTRRARNIIGGR
jgi:hypothetical protein